MKEYIATILVTSTIQLKVSANSAEDAKRKLMEETETQVFEEEAYRRGCDEISYITIEEVKQ